MVTDGTGEKGGTGGTERTERTGGTGESVVTVGSGDICITLIFASL